MLNRVSTGIDGLDQVIDFLRLGDNVVWQLNDIEDYQRLVIPFVRQAITEQRQVIYIRFASHPPLFSDETFGADVTTYVLQADTGFESFTTEVYQIITNAGSRAFYVFDCLSDLLDQWSSDLMIGNFFRITCPYLFELDTVAYFALRRDAHSFDTIARIRETTQVLIDIYHQGQLIYVHPLKVWQRYSSTMFLPHKMDGGQLTPITNSAEVAGLFSGANPLQYQTDRQLDSWDRLFLAAEQIPLDMSAERNAIFNRLCSLLTGEEGKIGSLSRQYFSLDDILDIKKRQIGTGKIGGKAIGMLLARKIIENDARYNPTLGNAELEAHDSFYLGSDLFYTYIVQNGWWKLRMEQKTPEGYFSKAQILKEKMLIGQFPSKVREQLQQMLEYFGQAPIIVRSSSLLEDDFGNAFAGKYESIFCANQGSPEERYNAFEQAIRVVYASMLDECALKYRQKRGLQNKDEQMALLVQRVSGSYHSHYFYPLLAGVGNSNNLYVWNKLLDPHAGMLRLVFGLGTRAVDRVEGDYPRIVALDQPLLSTHDSKSAEKTFSQHFVDLIDLAGNQLTTVSLEQLIKEDKDLNLEEVGEIDWEDMRHLAELGITGRQQWILNFKTVLSEKSFTETMRSILQLLEKAYGYPVDIEFTINRSTNGKRMINILQCRPLQTKSIGPSVRFPKRIDSSKLLVRSKGHFMGGNVSLMFKYVIYVRPEKYVELNEQERYQVARIIGQLNQTIADPDTAPTLLLGPGRWGTSTPSLGIPIRFSEINNVSALGEIAFETAGMIPEISFGSHFFQDLVEANVFYLAILPRQDGNLFQTSLINEQPNLFASLMPQFKDWEAVIAVCDFSAKDLTLFSDIQSQQLICLLAERPDTGMKELTNDLSSL